MSVEEDACAGNDLFVFLHAIEHFLQRVAAAAKLHFAAFVCVRCAPYEDAGRASGLQHGAARDGEDFGGVEFDDPLGEGFVF